MKHFMERAFVPFFFIAAAIVIALGESQGGIVIVLYVIAVLLDRIEHQLSRRAGARGESDG